MMLSRFRLASALAVLAAAGAVAPIWAQKIPVTFNLNQAGSRLTGLGTVTGRYPTDITSVNTLTLSAQTAAGGLNGSRADFTGTINTVMGFQLESQGGNAFNSFRMAGGDLDAVATPTSGTFNGWAPQNWDPGTSTFLGGPEPADYGFRVLSFVNSALRNVILDVNSVEQSVTAGGTVALNSQFNLNFKTGDLDLDADALGTVDQLSLVDDIVKFETAAGTVAWRNVIGDSEFGNPMYDSAALAPAFSSGVDADMFESDPVVLFDANGRTLSQLLVNNNVTAPNSNLVIAPGGFGRNLTLNLDVDAAALFFLGDFLVSFRFDGSLQGTASIPNDPYPLDGDAINNIPGQTQVVSGADFTVWADNFGQWPKTQVDFTPAITAGTDAPVNGQLTADATFQVVVENLQAMTQTTTSITVTSAATASNASVADLVADVNAALGAAGLTGQVAASVDGNRVKFSGVANGASTRGLQLIAASGTPAQAQLGLTNAGPATFIDQRFKTSTGVLTGDAVFSVKVGTAAPVVVNVTGASTAGNLTAFDLSADVDAAFAAAGVTIGNSAVVFDQTARTIGSDFVTLPNFGTSQFTVQVGTGAPVMVSANSLTVFTLDDLVDALNLSLVASGVTNVTANNTDGSLEFRVAGSSQEKLTITTTAGDALVTNGHFQTTNVADPRYRLSFNSTGAGGDNELVEITAVANSVATNQLGLFQINQKRGGIRSVPITSVLTPTAANGDFNGDGTVTGADFTIWADNFGESTIDPAPVPEPSALVLLAVGALALFGLRKRMTG